MQVNIKKLTDDAVIPQYAMDGDAGLDLTAVSKTIDKETDTIKYGFGIALQIPNNYVGLIFPRSSIYKTGTFLSNAVGVIDSGYRGEISVVFKNSTSESQYNIGDRVAQIIIIPIPSISFIPVRKLTKTDRGDKGYGSTKGFHNG